jgi:hypothetical protein
MKLLETWIGNTCPLLNYNLFAKVQVRAWCMHQTIWEKKGVLQLALQFNFWIAMTICNSLYFYVVSAIGQVAWVTRVATYCMYNATHCNSVATLSQ